MENAKALFVIVNAGFADEIVSITREMGAGGATIINARGGNAKHQTIMGITVDAEKEIVLSIVEAKIATKIMDTVKERAGIKSLAHGICFVLPVDKMAGLASVVNI